MRALITGAEGFAGSQLIAHLRQQYPDIELHGTTFQQSERAQRIAGVVASITQVDLRDEDAVAALVEQVRPDIIYHLAAQAFVPRSFQFPWETLENNIRGQLNIFQACIHQDLKPRLLVVSSAEVYGIVPPEQMPLHESVPFAPTNPYSVSKVAQDMLGLQYFLSHQLPVIRVRPFNHIGPGQQQDFVAPAFALQIARIEAGLQEPVISVGDLSARRDFTDVRDVVAAYHLAVTRGAPGAVYNICSGQAYSIQYLLDTLISFSQISVSVSVDSKRLRKAERPLVVGSAARLQADTGWAPQIPFEQSLKDVLEDCRERVALEQQNSK